MKVLSTTLLAICLINLTATSSHGFGLLWRNLCRPAVALCQCCCSNVPSAVDPCAGMALSDAPAVMAHGDTVIEHGATDVPAAPTEVSEGDAAPEADAAAPPEEDVASPSDLDGDEDAAAPTEEDAAPPADDEDAAPPAEEDAPAPAEEAADSDA